MVDGLSGGLKFGPTVHAVSIVQITVANDRAIAGPQRALRLIAGGLAPAELIYALLLPDRFCGRGEPSEKLAAMAPWQALPP